tara:strand:- start:10530 stop:10874 length:345 start_codon:yes stop_codon:yes gene_type:complete
LAKKAVRIKYQKANQCGMLIDMTKKAHRILNELPEREAVYQTLGNIELMLGQTHLLGNIEVDEKENGIGLKINHTNFAGPPFVKDLCEQLNYLIECSPQLEIPIEIKINRVSTK